MPQWVSYPEFDETIGTKVLRLAKMHAIMNDEIKKFKCLYCILKTPEVILEMSSHFSIRWLKLNFGWASIEALLLCFNLNFSFERHYLRRSILLRKIKFPETECNKSEDSTKIEMSCLESKHWSVLQSIKKQFVPCHIRKRI